MTLKSGSLSYWRDYFSTASYDILDIIEHAIMVAASDCPKEFRLQRDRIAELLFSTNLTHCSGCDRLQLVVPADNDEEDDGGCKSGLDRDGGEIEAGASKESKANNSRDDYRDINMDQGFSNLAYRQAEALTDEMEEESQIVGEVLRIKEILCNSVEESHSVIYESLRRLQLMALTVDILQATEIGKIVSGLRKHRSKEIRILSKTLYSGWKELAEEWLKATTTVAASEGTPDSVNPSLVGEEEGLPSPPMDEAFFATQTGAMDISQFFDGMDDDGNPRNSSEHTRNCENGRKPALDSQNMIIKKRQCSSEANVAVNDNKIHKIKKQELGGNLKKESTTPLRQEKLLNADSGPGRTRKLVKEQKQNCDISIQKRVDKIDIQRTPMFVQQDDSKCSKEDAVQMKLEATKRKLQESYQQVEKAKKQRTIQVMELHDLPKQGTGHRNWHVKPGSQIRNYPHGRR